MSADEYVVELEVLDFGTSELSVEATGRVVSVRGDQAATDEDEGKPFERLEESFRLPDDADVAHMRVFYEHGFLELHVPRVPPTPRRPPIERPRSRPVLDPDAEGV